MFAVDLTGAVSLAAVVVAALVSVLGVVGFQNRRARTTAIRSAFEEVVASLASTERERQLAGAVLLRRFFDRTSELGMRDWRGRQDGAVRQRGQERPRRRAPGGADRRSAEAARRRSGLLRDAGPRRPATDEPPGRLPGAPARGRLVGRRRLLPGRPQRRVAQEHGRRGSDLLPGTGRGHDLSRRRPARCELLRGQPGARRVHRRPVWRGPPSRERSTFPPSCCPTSTPTASTSAPSRLLVPSRPAGREPAVSSSAFRRPDRPARRASGGGSAGCSRRTRSAWCTSSSGTTRRRARSSRSPAGCPAARAPSSSASATSPRPTRPAPRRASRRGPTSKPASPMASGCGCCW